MGISINPPQLSDLFSSHNSIWGLLEHAFEGVVVANPDGFIIYMNQTYQDFLCVQDVIGRHVTDVIENTRMHIVAQTLKPELSAVQRIRGSEMIAHRIPVFENGKPVAVVGTVVFQDVRELKALASMVEKLRQEVDYYKQELRRKSSALYEFENIVGTNTTISELKAFAKRVAKSDTTILITGESGTGKELFAHAIHGESRRAMGPFIRVNCAAIPDTLLESELFGYEDGAFTGASRKGKKGKFELAHNGTILLDEIGDMSLTLQAKLLRVLQEREIERVGGSHPISVDVRFISSTHQNLEDRIAQGLFREDLFYRLNVVRIDVPPLRERLEDIPALVFSILSQLSDSVGTFVRDVDDRAWSVLRNHHWPGNIRELRNVLEYALHMMDGDILRAEHITTLLNARKDSHQSVVTLKDTVHNAERSAILKALAKTNWDKIEAAQLLGISRSSLYYKLDEYGIRI